MLVKTLIVVVVLALAVATVHWIDRLRRGRIDRPPRGSSAHQRALALDREARYPTREPERDRTTHEETR